MSTTTAKLESSIIRKSFSAFSRFAFMKVHGEKLGDQPYVDHLCHTISQLIDGKINRLLLIYRHSI